MSIYESEIITKLKKVLAETNGNCLDVLYMIYEEYMVKGNAGEILQFLCEYRDKIGKEDGSSERVPISVEMEIRNSYREFTSQSVSLLLGKNETVEEFYADLWNAVFMSPTSPESKEACAVLLKMLCKETPVLPYYQAKNVKRMDNEEFKTLVQKNGLGIMEAFHMIHRPFTQKTELASQIYRLMENLDEDDSCVFLAACFSLMQDVAYRMGKKDGISQERTEQENKLNKLKEHLFSGESVEE